MPLPRKIGSRINVGSAQAVDARIAEQKPPTLKELSALMPQSPWRLKTFGAQILQASHDK